jgi:hypothetical protein
MKTITARFFRQNYKKVLSEMWRGEDFRIGSILIGRKNYDALSQEQADNGVAHASGETVHTKEQTFDNLKNRYDGRAQPQADNPECVPLEEDSREETCQTCKQVVDQVIVTWEDGEEYRTCKTCAKRVFAGKNFERYWNKALKN